MEGLWSGEDLSVDFDNLPRIGECDQGANAKFTRRNNQIRKSIDMTMVNTEQALVKKQQRAESLPPLRCGHQFPVCERDYHVGHQEEHELPVDEFVDGSLPLEEEPCEATGSRASHITLVRDGHLVLVKSCFPRYHCTLARLLFSISLRLTVPRTDRVLLLLIMLGVDQSLSFHYWPLRRV